MSDDLSIELFELNLDNHGTSETIAVTCIATGEVVARFDFCQDELTARRNAQQFVEALKMVYSTGASLNIHGLEISDQFLDREYCWPEYAK